jgi:CubicO group peptidase (beta-lactamase class C family)
LSRVLLIIYNHYNVYLQMRIIEKVSGMPYADFIKKNILMPCGMTQSGINYPVNAADMAQAFDSEFKPTAYSQSMTGWIRLTITDLYKWTESLHQGKVISRASLLELAANFPGGKAVWELPVWRITGLFGTSTRAQTAIMKPCSIATSGTV